MQIKENYSKGVEDMFDMPKYVEPDFHGSKFMNSPNVQVGEVVIKGVAPDNYHATSIYPEYFKIDGQWLLAEQSRMDSVPVLENGKIIIKEFRRLEIGDEVILGRRDDGSGGIYLHENSFIEPNTEIDAFAFRSGRSRETPFSKDYEKLCDLLKHEKNHGKVVWVLGPAVVFDYRSRNAMASLVDKGHVDALFGGNAIATHDLESAFFGTALGQDIQNQDLKPNGHYHHLDAINMVSKSGSIEKAIRDYKIQDGIFYSCVKNNVPFVLGGSIRDDGPLPDVCRDVYEAQDEMRNEIKDATTIICLATQLHSIAAGNLTPSYTVVNGEIRPIFIYAIDVSEFALNKLRDRGTLEVTTIVSNIQDFLYKLNGLLENE